MGNGVRFETGTYGLRAVLTGPWSEETAHSVVAHGAVELELNRSKGWRGHDLRFLETLPHLLVFEILDLGIEDVSAIHALHALKALDVNTYCSTEIRFSAFPDLEDCSLEWRARARSVFDCTTLKRLFINRYKGKDTAPFANLVSLERLGLLNAPITNVHGLSGLRQLQRLRLGALRCLESLAGIEELTSLERLNVDTCRRIRLIDPIVGLTHLRELYVNNCGEIESLKPLDGLVSLEAVTFDASTNVRDGDMSVLTHLPNLSRLAFANRRHYTHRCEEFRAYTNPAP